MGNCIRIVKRLFTKSSRLAAILNKSRIFNTYEMLVELSSVIFFNTVPSRTNQTFYVGLSTVQAFICIIGHMYIHVSPRRHFFRNSIILNLMAQGFMLVIIWLTSVCFKAVINDCQTIWEYYEIIGKEPLANEVCKNAIIYYAMWIVISVIIIAIRIFAFVYMIKSYRYLMKREGEKLRKKQRRLEKAKRIRKEMRRALHKQALEQKNEMYKKQDELIKEIEDRANQMQ